MNKRLHGIGVPGPRGPSVKPAISCRSVGRTSGQYVKRNRPARNLAAGNRRRCVLSGVCRRARNGPPIVSAFPQITLPISFGRRALGLLWACELSRLGQAPPNNIAQGLRRRGPHQGLDVRPVCTWRALFPPVPIWIEAKPVHRPGCRFFSRRPLGICFRRCDPDVGGKTRGKGKQGRGTGE